MTSTYIPTNRSMATAKRGRALVSPRAHQRHLVLSGRQRERGNGCQVSRQRQVRSASTVSSHLSAAAITLTFILGWAVVAWVFFSFSNAPLG